VGLVSLSGDDPRFPDFSLVRSWVTTPDARQLLTEQTPTTFRDADPTSAAVTIAVDPTLRYQVVEGFGASITDSSAAVLYRLDPRARDAAMLDLFDLRTGAGLSYLRQPMGASDFVDEDAYTYDDVAPGETDYSMAHFSVEHDRAQILPLLRRAKALDPQLRIMATPWSAPAWMKTSGSLVRGSLVDDPRVYQAYALYFVRFLQAYAAAGVPVDAVTVQNEPQVEPSNSPGMHMSPAAEARFISVLGPALHAAGLGTLIVAHDDTWAAAADHAAGIISDPAAARWIDGVAFHCYAGNAAAQSDVHRVLPGARILLSECSGYRQSGETSSETFTRELGTNARILVNAIRNWAGGVLTWNLALDPRGGPHRGGCGVCTGVVTVGPEHKVTRNAEYYVLASVSRLVRPGAVRIASTSFRLAGDKGGLITAAFRDSHGSIALVVYNQSRAPRRFAVQVGNRSFPTSLPGGALGAYSWSARAEAGAAVLLAPSQMTATTSPAGPTDPCCTGDVAAHAVDGDGGTRWSTGHSQRTGDHLDLDLGRRRRVARVVLDAGLAAGDTPHRWALYAGDEPGGSGRPVAEGSGTGQLTSIDTTGVTARYLRVVTTGRASTWWSVADVRVYVDR
jgi:glucosylceramidase